MSEPTPAPVEPKPTEPTPQGGELSPEAKGLLRDLQAQRESNKALKDQLDAITKANEEAETARLAEQNEFKTLYETEKAKVAEYEPVVETYNTYMSAKKTALLEQLGDDADDFSGLDVPALEKVVAKITKLSNAPSEPGKPGMSPSGEFGGFKTMDELASAVSRGVPGARESWDRIRGA
jgi:hypothetical protein